MQTIDLCIGSFAVTPLQFIPTGVGSCNYFLKAGHQMARRWHPHKLGTIDLETGEIFEGGVPVWVGAKLKWREDFFMAIQDAFLALAKDPEMTGETTRVLHYMMGHLGFENWIDLPQKQIANDLNLQRPNVSRAVKVLLEKGVILKGPKLGHTNAYRLNSTYGWKGKIVNLEEARRKGL